MVLVLPVTFSSNGPIQWILGPMVWGIQNIPSQEDKPLYPLPPANKKQAQQSLDFWGSRYHSDLFIDKFKGCQIEIGSWYREIILLQARIKSKTRKESQCRCPGFQDSVAEIWSLQEKHKWWKRYIEDQSHVGPESTRYMSRWPKPLCHLYIFCTDAPPLAHTYSLVVFSMTNVGGKGKLFPSVLLGSPARACKLDRQRTD